MEPHIQEREKQAAIQRHEDFDQQSPEMASDRPEHIAQMKIQDAANQSPHVQRIAQLKEAADNSTQTRTIQAKGGGTKTVQAKKDHVPSHDASDFSKGRAKRIRKSMIAAYKMAVKAQKNISKTNRKYKRWMDAGKEDVENQDDRVTHVKSGFSKIAKVLKEEEVKLKKYDLNDGEERETYAYVDTSEAENNIYLGGMFWKASTKGWNSKAGTIIHELSHKVHNTDDHVYGKKGARKLAKDDPHKATRNADNYEYLAEGS